MLCFILILLKESESVMPSISDNEPGTYWYSNVNADLQFYEESKSGVDMYIPYIVFQCQIQQSHYYTDSYDAYDDGLYYYVTW